MKAFKEGTSNASKPIRKMLSNICGIKDFPPQSV
jgi:hypothetical protein